MQQASPLTAGAAPASAVNRVLTRSFLWMFVALVVSAVTAWLAGQSAFLQDLDNGGGLVTLILLVVWLVLSIGFKPIVKRVPAPVIIVLLALYSVLTGITLSATLAVFTTASIVLALIATGVLFGAMTLFALIVPFDHRKTAWVIVPAFIAMVLVSLLNFFWLHSATLEWILALAGILLFAFTTFAAVKQIAAEASTAPESELNRVALVGAALLFTNFIGLFMRILQATGKKK